MYGLQRIAGCIQNSLKSGLYIISWPMPHPAPIAINHGHSTHFQPDVDVFLFCLPPHSIGISHNL